MRNGRLPVISVNKGYHSHQLLEPLPTVSWWALRELRKEKNTWHLVAIRLQPLPTVSPEETQDMRILASDSWGAYQKNDFSEPRLMHPPIHRKALNSLTWDIWFSLTIIFWHSDYLPSIAKLLCILAPPSPPRSSSLRVTWDATSWAWSLKNFCRIKCTSQILGCHIYFF